LRNGLKLYVSSNLELVSGTAELEFGDGAKVILEGPTKLVIDGASRGRLSHGKLYAKVPPRAAGFTIQTPASTIVDLGTEFGVEVDRLGREQIHVFKGRVQLATTKFNDDGQAVVSSIELDAGQAALVEPQAPGIRAIAADERQFSARGFQVENLIDDAELIVGPAYVRDVVASRPLAYWRFENEQNGWVRNEMGSRWPVRLNGVRLVGPEENRHAAFQDNAFKQWIEPEGRLDGLQGDAFSIELWVKPQRFADAELVLGYDGEGSNETASLALSLLGEGNETTPEKRLRFLHRNPPGPEDGVNAFSEATYALQRWHYLVAVKRGAEMSLYVNGKLVGSASDPTSLGRAQHLLIGRLATEFKSEPQPPRQLVGDLDEIAIYNRALSEEVIQRRFELVRDGPAP
jgi:hypothetical protein